MSTPVWQQIRYPSPFGRWRTGFLHTGPEVLGITAAAAVLGTLLCTLPVRRLMRLALEPDLAWTFVPLRRPRRA